MKNLLKSSITIALLALLTPLIIVGCGGKEDSTKTCNPTCDSAQCQTCDVETCVSTCSEDQTCNTGICEANCNPECNTDDCMTCEDGTCSDLCTEEQTCNTGICEANCNPECNTDDCMTCEDGTCISVCTEEQTCNAGTCQEFLICDPECNIDDCLACINGTCEFICTDTETCNEGTCKEHCEPECDQNACEVCTEEACLYLCEDGQICEEGECYEISECGDGTIEGIEDCEGEELNGANCVDLGFDGGHLTCNDFCHFDTLACEGCGHDEFENNPDAENAARIELGIYELTLCRGEQDWFVIYINAGDTLAVGLDFIDNILDIDMALFDIEQNMLDTSTGISNTEMVAFTSEVNKRVLIKIHGVGSTSSSYIMNISLNPDCTSDDDCEDGNICTDFECIEECRYDSDCTEKICLENICINGCRSNNDCSEGKACENNICFTPECMTSGDCNNGNICVDYECTACEEDSYEPNNTAGESVPLVLDFYEENLALCGARARDWYLVELEELTSYEFNIYFSHELGDIDFHLYEQTNPALAKAFGVSINDDENLSYNVPNDAGGTYLLKIDLHDSNRQIYTMDLIADDEIECLTSDDCNLENLCLNNACFNIDCITSDHCEEEELCFDYECIIPECESNNECESGQLCEDYVCIDFACSEENICPSGLQCVEGTCVGCIDETNCPNTDDFTCEDQVCVLRCEEDFYEPNSASNEPAAIEIDFFNDALTLCGQNDADWFSFELQASRLYDFDLTFIDAEGGIDFKLYKADNLTTVLISADSLNDNETMEYPVSSDGTGTYYLEVNLIPGNYTQNYDLTITETGEIECAEQSECDEEDQICLDYMCITPECENNNECEIDEMCAGYICVDLACDEANPCPSPMQCFNNSICVECINETDCPNIDDFNCENNVCVLQCEEDFYEPNSTDSEPAAIEIDFSNNTLSLCGQNNADWFSFELQASRLYNFDVIFINAEGNVDFGLYKADNLTTALAFGNSITDNESTEYPVPSDSAGTYYLKIYLQPDQNDDYAQNYELAITEVREIECIEQNECSGENQLCFNYECITTECENNSECEIDEICEDYTCIEFICDEENSCPGGLICNESRCVNCLEPDDCDPNYPEDFICTDFTCVLQCEEDNNEPNTDAESAEVILIPHTMSALTLCENSAEDWFKFELDSSISYAFVTTFLHSEGNIDLYLYAQNDTTAPVIDATGSSDNENIESITYNVPENGDGVYYLVVTLISSNAQTYNITIDILGCLSDEACGDDEICMDLICLIPECGNGLTEGDEQCDDNNTDNGDGCDETCMAELNPDEEPNNFSDEATEIIVPGVAFGFIEAQEDMDWFVFTVEVPGTYTFETSDSTSGFDTVDTQIFLCDNLNPGECNYSDGNLEANDDGENGFYSTLSFELEANTTYYIVVQSFLNSTGYYKLTGSISL